MTHSQNTRSPECNARYPKPNRRLNFENRLWEYKRIQGKFGKLGHGMARSTV